MNKKTALVVIAALMITACSRMESPVQEGTPVALRYTSFDIMGTKAAQDLNEGTFAEGETVKVRISNTGAGSWTDYDFTTAAAGAMTAPDPGPYYPTGSQNIDIVAYYPASAGTLFSVQADQTSDDAYKASDLMFASVTDQAKQAEAVNLAFTHKLAKINVNITAGAGIGSITGISILNVKPTVSFDQVSGAVGEASGEAISIAMSDKGAALIPAQTITGNLLSVVTDKGTATYSVPDGKAFVAGQQYTLNILVKLRAIGTTRTITGWTGESTVSVDFERPGLIAGHDYVEMGDGLKWSTCNMRAYVSREYDDYYAWGALLPNYRPGRDLDWLRDIVLLPEWRSGMTGYDWASYPFMELGQSDAEHITKYILEDRNEHAVWYSEYFEFIGDGKTSFADYDYADDAARQVWGSTWRIPTDEEWTALRNTDNYSWVWTANYLDSGNNGYIVTRLNGPCEGNSIFLPASGWVEDERLYKDGVGGCYWSSSLADRNAGALCVQFESNYVTGGSRARCHGISIRPVSE